MTSITGITAIALAGIGWLFSLSGAVGILRMPDLYSRIQCSSKTITMGALPTLIALVVGEGPVSTYGSRALLVAAALLVVNPAASHALARAAYKVGVPMWPGAVTDQVSARGRVAPHEPDRGRGHRPAAGPEQSGPAEQDGGGGA